MYLANFLSQNSPIDFTDEPEIVGHATVKTAEVVSAKLPYVGSDFQVSVVQESDFAVARDRLLNATSYKIEIKTEPVTSDGLNEWLSSNDVLVDALDRKLRKLHTLPSEDARAAFKAKVLRWYLEGQSVLAELRKYPQLYEKVIKTKAHRENFLVMASIRGDAPHEIFSAALNQLFEALQSEAKELHQFSAEILSFEAVADWLFRCPLDFPEIRHG